MSIELTLENIAYQYSGIGASDSPVLRNISFTLRPNERVAIVGPSGSGKTTLIQHFTGLLKPTSGRVLVDGKNIHEKNYSFTLLRRRIGLVFQFPESQLFEETVFKDVAFGPLNLKLTAEEVEQRIGQALTMTGLNSDSIADRSPFRLSEGEKRKVAIAGVLAMQPEMVVLDEPTAGLDPVGVQSMVDLMYSLHDRGATPVFITHNMDFVADVAQRVLVLSGGSLLFDGTPEQLFSQQAILIQARLELPNFIQAFAPYRAALPQSFQSIISYRQLVREASQWLS